MILMSTHNICFYGVSKIGTDKKGITIDNFHQYSIKTYEPPRDKTNKMASAPSEDSDQPGSLATH